MRARQGLAVLIALGAALGTSLTADTLILRDGRRVSGVLVSVRDGVVDFEGRRGFGGRERIRVDREEVARIELDDARDDRDERDQRFGDGRFGDPRDRESGGRLDGMREREVTVSATEPWRDTGIALRAGQSIRFRAAGRLRWGPGRQDGPGGEDDSPRNPGRPMPNRPAAALIGRIGNGDPFFIGDSTAPIRVRDSGTLYLGINDDYLQDNSGAFRVAIAY